MTHDEMLAMVHATHLPIALPKVAEPVDLDVQLSRFYQRAWKPREAAEPAGVSFTVTRVVLPITCTREELGARWGWP